MELTPCIYFEVTEKILKKSLDILWGISTAEIMLSFLSLGLCWPRNINATDYFKGLPSGNKIDRHYEEFDQTQFIVYLWSLESEKLLKCDETICKCLHFLFEYFQYFELIGHFNVKNPLMFIPSLQTIELSSQYLFETPCEHLQLEDKMLQIPF